MTTNQLYKVGWLNVSRKNNNDSNLQDSSLGDLVKNYISTLTSNKKENDNLYFSVLKNNTLYLYDSEKQLDSKGVINLSQINIKMYPDGLLDAELFSKPNLIHLKNQDMEYYINCDKCIDKEDWYFTLIRASKFISPNMDLPQDKTHFIQSDMNTLIKSLYSDEHNFQNQWFNALLGRLFFGVYRTDQIKDALLNKVITKLDKINSKRPPFLGEITVRSADPGHAMPRLTQPKLISLSPAGELSAQVMFQYDGGLRLEIETELKWQYSDRLKPLTIDLVLGITLKEISGNLLVKIKEPPTNRLWYAFSEPPKMEWKVEPVVWEKQIGYSVVVKAIETKIQEFIIETMVFPHFDDITFFPTEGFGGIFESSPIQTHPSKETMINTTTTLPSVKNRLEQDEALLSSAKSLPELFSAVPHRTTSSEDLENLLILNNNTTSPTFTYSDTHSYSPLLSPFLDPMTIPSSNQQQQDFGLSTSFDESLLSSSPGSSIDDSSEYLSCQVTTYSQETHFELELDQKLTLRKSSSLALLRQKTSASTAVNISPAMAHKPQNQKKDTDSIAVLSI